VRKFNKYYLWFIGISILYCALILIIPPDASVLRKYSLTALQAKFLTFSFAIPILFIWFLGFFGFSHIKDYARIIRNNKDGKSLNRLADGLLVLVLGGALSTIISSVLNYLATVRPRLIPMSVIVNNYLGLLILLGAFYLIYQGAEGLIKAVRKHIATTSEILSMAVFIAFSVLYVYITLANPYRQFPPPNNSVKAAYYTNDIILVLTIILPYLVVWFYGIRSTYFIRQYSRKAPGILYRQALAYLSAGIGIVIVSSMLLRFLTSLTSTLDNLTLKILLLLLYILVAIIGIGYGLIAAGAKKLKKFEEV
jgi:hypothetical protein